MFIVTGYSQTTNTYFNTVSGQYVTVTGTATTPTIPSFGIGFQQRFGVSRSYTPIKRTKKAGMIAPKTVSTLKTKICYFQNTWNKYQPYYQIKFRITHNSTLHMPFAKYTSMQDVEAAINRDWTVCYVQQVIPFPGSYRYKMVRRKMAYDDWWF